MLFMVVASTVMVTTFLLLTAWKKIKRRRRLRFRTPHQKNGWSRDMIQHVCFTIYYDMFP